jgi:hypothetical protein
VWRMNTEKERFVGSARIEYLVLGRIRHETASLSCLQKRGANHRPRSPPRWPKRER